MAFHKRAEIEVQFNWMFVLIAGGLILILFGLIVLKQKEAATANAERTTLRAIKSLIAGASATAGTSNTVSLPKTTLTFECNTIRAGEGERREDFASLIAFSPKVIETPQLVIDTKQWSIPYNAGTLVYITSPRVRYVVLGTSPLKKPFCDMFPKALAQSIIGCTQDLSALPSDFSASTDERIRFIYFGPIQPPPQSASRLENTQVTALEVNTQQQRLTFYMKQGAGWSQPIAVRPYIELATLYGAAYADGFEAGDTGPLSSTPSYDCSMRNALKRAALITLAQRERAQALGIRFPQCSTSYQNAYSRFDAIYARFNSASTSSDFPQSLSITQESSALSTINRELQQQSCPLLY